MVSSPARITMIAAAAACTLVPLSVTGSPIRSSALHARHSFGWSEPLPRFHLPELQRTYAMPSKHHDHKHEHKHEHNHNHSRGHRKPGSHPKRSGKGFRKVGRPIFARSIQVQHRRTGDGLFIRQESTGGTATNGSSSSSASGSSSSSSSSSADSTPNDGVNGSVPIQYVPSGSDSSSSGEGCTPTTVTVTTTVYSTPTSSSGSVAAAEVTPTPLSGSSISTSSGEAHTSRVEDINPLGSKEAPSATALPGGAPSLPVSPPVGAGGTTPLTGIPFVPLPGGQSSPPPATSDATSSSQSKASASSASSSSSSDSGSNNTQAPVDAQDVAQHIVAEQPSAGSSAGSTASSSGSGSASESGSGSGTATPSDSGSVPQTVVFVVPTTQSERR
ncbi:hypothetical protein AX16_001759 [Volvariella volvacea WC 439]|nr:hypothetical protein AX16_001759 [Volvariella volvacea WC 439]